MEFGNILRTLDENTRALVRCIEKISYKVNNAVSAVDFNKTCIQHGLLPKYIYVQVGRQIEIDMQCLAYIRLIS